MLLSPTRRTAWLDPELRCDDWDTSEAVRGATGIHAHLVPEHWEAAESEYVSWLTRPSRRSRDRRRSPPIVTGIFERFGRYVLGAEGWRAEWVIVRKLRAPTPEIAEALALAYPDVEIIHGNRQGC